MYDKICECAMCKKIKKCYHQESRTLITFGVRYGHGHPPTHEFRCQKCERILIKQIDSFLKRLQGA